MIHSSKSTDLESTARLIGRARKLLAYGGLDGVLQRPLLDHDGNPFPHFAVSAEGCRIVDSTGRQLIDWVNGWGPVLLGYRNSEVEQAIADQLKAGPTLSLMNPVEIQVAELIEELVPCAEMVAFGKNGSDSVTAALRIARAATKRDVILQFGFHGFHEWYTCLHPQVQGLTPGLKEYVDTFEYNDINGLEALFQKYPQRVAAVIMEPVNMWMPEPGYLQALRELTHAHGALLIFDEMVTAFRVAPGGAQELFGVQPDLACLGKGMANGMPLSAVVGARNLMQLLPSCGFGMTFRGETLSLAAAKATLEIIRDQPVCEHLSSIGQQLRTGVDALCEELGVRCELSGPDARMTFVFHDQGALGWSDARAIFLQECLQCGVLTNGNLLPNWAHDQQAVEETLAVFRKAFMKVVSCVKESSSGDPIPVGGFMFGLKALRVIGFVEQIDFDEERSTVSVAGWVLLDSGAPDAIELHSDCTDVITRADQVERPDLVSGFPDRENVDKAGFYAEISRADYESEKFCRFTIKAIKDGDVVWQCIVEFQGRVDATGPWPVTDGVLYL